MDGNRAADWRGYFSVNLTDAVTGEIEAAETAAVEAERRGAGHADALAAGLSAAGRWHRRWAPRAAPAPEPATAGRSTGRPPRAWAEPTADAGSWSMLLAP